MVIKNFYYIVVIIIIIRHINKNVGFVGQTNTAMSTFHLELSGLGGNLVKSF